MNIQQLEYIVAVDTYRHFAKAAEASFVTQPTLSMMIQKLEEELGVKIFDRGQQPVQPTPIGTLIINQARIIVSQVKQVKNIVDEEKGVLQGNLRLGVIPTIAPYLLPELIRLHNLSNNEVELVIEEATTDQILDKLIAGTLDVGLLATPLNNDRLREHPIYYERFFAYVSPEETSLYAKRELSEEDLNINRLWLLTDTHCLKNQILKLCNMRRKRNVHTLLSYEAGSIATLVNIVDNNSGLTIIPEMALRHLSERQQQNVRPLKSPVPVREVSLVTRKEFLRERMLDILTQEIRASVPQEMLSKNLKDNVLTAI